MKFAGTLVAMTRSRWIPEEAHKRVKNALGVLSPYQFSDIFLALLLLSYLNLDNDASVVHCSVRRGFVWFLVYCIVSVALAQSIEAKDEERDGLELVEQREQPATGRTRSLTDSVLEMAAPSQGLSSAGYVR